MRQLIDPIIFLLFLFWSNGINAQQTEPPRTVYFSVGSRKAGICFGNSPRYTGLRLNLIDRNVNRVNILNFSLLKAEAKRSNGLSLGVFVNLDSLNNGLSFGFLGNSGQKRNGIAIAGLYSYYRQMNGIGIAGIRMTGDTLNGLFIALGGIGTWKHDGKKFINGLAISMAGSRTENVNGVTIGCYHHSDRLRGLSIGIYNKSKNLHGVQLGILNYAGNNPKGLRWLPLMNFHFGKDRR